MTDNIAIRVENLSKRYRIGRAQSHGDSLRSQRPDTLRDALEEFLPRIGRSSRKHNSSNSSSSWQKSDELWTLRDLSFKVQRGEVVGALAPALRFGASAGAIGRSGTGKAPA